ncbi:IclR family transcriptional regulator [Kiloniella sp. b19]|uniref:IclR family transcriptional regulator n=1 Tax=Kiloniella sp. GXU_MW_B19 TaxID=3141326 RepID=UPI0031D292E4
MTTTAKRGRKAGRPASGNAASGSVQSLTRALSLLEQLSFSDNGLNLGEVSTAVELAPSTTHRLLSTMLQMGFVEYDEQLGLWSVGVNSFTVGNAYLKKRSFATQARPLMKDLMNASGETCNLAVLEGGQVVFIAQIESRDTMRMVVNLGSRGPLHATAVGKALLSALPEREARGIVEGLELTGLTDRSLTSREALLQELDSVRQKGFAVDDEEQKIGLTCLAANIYDEHHEAVAAISISGPSVRVTPQRLDELGRMVMETADRITAVIGGT